MGVKKDAASDALGCGVFSLFAAVFLILSLVGYLRDLF